MNKKSIPLLKNISVSLVLLFVALFASRTGWMGRIFKFILAFYYFSLDKRNKI